MSSAKPKLKISPRTVIKGEKIRLSGRIPGGKARKVILQRKGAKSWVKVKSTRSSRKGKFSFRLSMKWRQTRFRVKAPATGSRKKRLKNVTSRVIKLKAARQSGHLAIPTWFETGTRITVTAGFSPVRRGRPVKLERSVDGKKWTRVGSGKQDRFGKVAFKTVIRKSQVATYRAVALKYRGAGAARTDVRRGVAGIRQSFELSAGVQKGSLAPLDTSGVLSDIQNFDVVDTPDGIDLAVNNLGEVTVSAASSVNAGTYTSVANASGCYSETCDVGVRLQITIEVSEIQMSWGDDITNPSPDRVAASKNLGAGVKGLADEIVLTLGTPVEPGDIYLAWEIAEEFGAIVTGGISDIGVYQLRWETPPDDLDAIIQQLLERTDVSGASRTTIGAADVTAVPDGDWADDGEAVKWPFRQIRAMQAWDIAKGTSTSVGIVDGGPVWGKHEDLNVVDTLNPDGRDDHGTHVAGLACAKQNGKGVVGVAWGCPITTRGVPASGDQTYSDLNVLRTAQKAAATGVRVVNISMGWGREDGQCMSASQTKSLEAPLKTAAAPFLNLFNGHLGQGVLWTLSAGNNCATGPQSPYGQQWALPNVITVAATNSDKRLASFSNFGPGVEVAAPGGVGVKIAGAGGLISTVPVKCRWIFTCSGYGKMYGTSMAAPVVAGIAALAFDAAPDSSAADIGSCIVATAGTDTGSATSRSTLPAGSNPRIKFTGATPIVNAQGAVRCATGKKVSGDILIAGAGDRTASGDGSDRGDLFRKLTEAGYRVVSSESIPSDVSGFRQIWHLDTEAMTSDEQDRVAKFVSAGKGLYLTGEWGCCSVDDSTIALINRLTDDSVHHNGSRSNWIDVGAEAPFGLGSTPATVASFQAATPGSLGGVDPANVVGYAGSQGSVVSAAWADSEVSGSGRIAVVMDINWVAWQYRGGDWDGYVRNLARFLSK